MGENVEYKKTNRLITNTWDINWNILLLERLDSNNLWLPLKKHCGSASVAVSTQQPSVLSRQCNAIDQSRLGWKYNDEIHILSKFRLNFITYLDKCLRREQGHKVRSVDVLWRARKMQTSLNSQISDVNGIRIVIMLSPVQRTDHHRLRFTLRTKWILKGDIMITVNGRHNWTVTSAKTGACLIDSNQNDDVLYT